MEAYQLSSVCVLLFDESKQDRKGTHCVLSFPFLFFAQDSKKSTSRTSTPAPSSPLPSHFRSFVRTQLRPTLFLPWQSSRLRPRSSLSMPQRDNSPIESVKVPLRTGPMFFSFLHTCMIDRAGSGSCRCCCWRLGFNDDGGRR